MSYWNLFDIGYNALERYHSDDAALISNKYNWELYVLRKSETDTETYIDKLLDILSAVLKTRITTVNEFRKLDYPFTYLCYPNKFLSDNEIRIGNEYSKWKYPTNSVLLLDSNIVQLFSDTGMIEKKDNPRLESPSAKMDLILNSSIIQRDDEQYIHWEHGCKILTKQLVRVTGNIQFIFLNNNHQLHWNSLFGFYENMTNEKGGEPRLYLLDSLNNANKECIHAHPTTIPESDKRLLTLVKLIKLLLFVNKYSSAGRKFIILNEDDDSIFINNKLSTELRTLFSTNKVNYVYVSQQNDTTSCGLHIINYFHSVLKLIYKIESSQQEKKFEASMFDTELRSLKAFKHHPKEYLLIRSDLLNFIVNFKFINHILEHKTLDLFISNDLPTGDIMSRINDLLDETSIETLDNEKTKQNNDSIAEVVALEINTFIRQIKEDDNVHACQCCTRFPIKQLQHLKQKNIQDDYPDIHQIPSDIVKNLYWKCRRFSTRSGKQKGAFYYKKVLSKDNYFQGINSIPGLLKVLGPNNPGYMRGKVDYSGEIKSTLLSRLSFNCMFKSAIIPDGGSCCEWIATSLLLSEENSKDYFSYLNGLRKILKIEQLQFPRDAQEINKHLRMLYAFSITYKYEPYIHEYMNYPNNVDLNYSYCRNVIGHMKFFCSSHKSTNDIVFQECCRNYYSLTPSQVGKFGCMWGQDDFLNWFQCVFNIRIFVISMNSYEVKKKTKITTSSEFVQSFRFQNSDEFLIQENYENDGIFDFNDEKKLIPYGIMIVLKEDLHYERLIIPYDQKSPLIPLGSESVTHLLPYLKISREVWVSISVDNVEQHNKEVLKRNKLDRNEELNYWYDCHVAYKKMKNMKFQVMPPVMENDCDITQHSVPKCAIKYYGFYIALLCYLSAIRNETTHRDSVANCDLYSIEMSELQEDQDTLLTMLEQENKKLYPVSSSLDTLKDPFKEEELCSHYRNCLIKMKEKIYCDYLKIAKDKKHISSNMTAYCSYGKRKQFVETVNTEQMIQNLVSEHMIPTHLLPIEEKPTTKELNTKFETVQKISDTLEALEDGEIKGIANLSEKIEKEMKINNDANDPSNDDDIFENTSSTVGGKSPGTSSLSSSSFAPHRKTPDVLMSVPLSLQLPKNSSNPLQTTPNKNPTQLQDKEQPNISPSKEIQDSSKTQ